MSDDNAASDFPLDVPDAQLMLFGNCTRCGATGHATFTCPLIGVGTVFRARHPGNCCMHACGQAFVCDGPITERSRIIALGDMG